MKSHYFQRYHSQENVHTANVVLLLSRIYHHHPSAFFHFISAELLEGESDLEISFRLQQKTGRSVPDALIAQPSIKLIVETKVGTSFNKPQLQGHVEAFNDEDHRVLITVSVSSLSRSDLEMVKSVVRNANEQDANRPPQRVKSIRHVHLRFRDLVDLLEPYLPAHDPEMTAMFADFKEYCLTSGLIENSHRLMRAVPTGNSFAICRRYKLYYAPSSRGYAAHGFIGFYTSKAVRAVGDVSKVVEVQLSPSGDLEFASTEPVDAEERSRIEDAIVAARDIGDPTVENAPYNFFFVKTLVEVNFVKKSKGGLWGTKMFDLYEMMKADKGGRPPNEPLSIMSVAALLNDRTWEEFESESV